MFVEPALEAPLESSTVWLCKKAFHGLKISPRAWGGHSTQKINDMSEDQLISDPSTYVKKKRTQRSDVSILHLMDVVVLRNEGDTVNFWGLEISEASRGSR